jgi:sensor histidine kinase regulating citrate/malate metabolism
LRHQEKEQYFISKENIELINLKCHDMRHQIRRIGENKSIAPETVKEIEDAISVYRLTAKTGNEALDVILTENNLRCYKNGITLTCVADGARLEFMHDADIYSLFGNALDNAIEAVLKIRETDSRVIGLKIHSVGELITINIRNSYADAITYNKDGYPVSTKGEPNYHGYGIKSISYIVEKYGGNLSISAKDGVFNLNILLSIPE